MTERLLPINGVELCVRTEGDPALPPLLLLHAAGHSLISWPDELCAALADTFHVIRYDSRDAGRSTASPAGAPPHTLRDLVADAAALLDGRRAHILGMSGGSAVAQLLALDHPVASLTLFASTPGGPGHDTPDLPDPLPLAEPAPPDWIDPGSAIDYIVEAERPYSADFDEAAMRDIATRVLARSRNPEAQFTNPFLIDPGTPWRDRLPEITAPTVVFHGEQDPFLPLPHGRALAAELNARFIPLPNTGHEVFPRHTWPTVLTTLRALA